MFTCSRLAVSLAWVTAGEFYSFVAFPDFNFAAVIFVLLRLAGAIKK